MFVQEPAGFPLQGAKIIRHHTPTTISLLNNKLTVTNYFKRLGSEVTRILDGNDQPSVLGDVVGPDAEIARQDELLPAKLDHYRETGMPRIRRPASAINVDKRVHSGHTIRNRRSSFRA